MKSSGVERGRKAKEKREKRERHETRGRRRGFEGLGALPLEITRALGEQVVLPVDVSHPVSEDHLPLVLHSLDLHHKTRNPNASQLELVSLSSFLPSRTPSSASSPSSHAHAHIPGDWTHLIIDTKHDIHIRVLSSTLSLIVLVVELVLGVVEIRVDLFVSGEDSVGVGDSRTCWCWRWDGSGGGWWVRGGG